MRRDLHNNIAITSVLNFTSVTTTPVSTSIIDTLGFNALEFVITCGANTTGTITPSFVWGNASDLSDGVAIDAAHLIGTIADATFTGNITDTIKRIGIYLTTFRYVQMTLTGSNTPTGGFFSVAAVTASPNLMPTN